MYKYSALTIFKYFHKVNFVATWPLLIALKYRNHACLPFYRYIAADIKKPMILLSSLSKSSNIQLQLKLKIYIRYNLQLR